MIAFDGSGRCRRAEAYYHDYLEDDSRVGVPRDVIDHIRACKHCQERVEGLREILEASGEGVEGGSSARDWRVVGELQRHFEFLGERVTCAAVKAFLPGLLDPSVHIRIPTPITVHVDQCPDCARDLESLRALDLDGEQLAALGSLYSKGSGEVVSRCRRLRSKVSVLISGALTGVDSVFLDHLGSCSPCRDELATRRRAFCGPGSCDFGGCGPISCETMLAGDVFDLVVPRRGPAGEHGREQACREHVAVCPGCRAKLEAVYRTVYGIAERADSGVITMCNRRAEGRVGGEGIEEDLYGDYPIEVRVLRESAVSADDSGAAWRGLGRRLRSRPLVKTAIVAAAMIPLAIMFTLSNPSASGLAVDVLGDAMTHAPYGRVSTLFDGEKEAREAFWIGRADGIVLWQKGGTGALFDLDKGEKTVVGRGPAAGEVVRLTAGRRAGGEGIIENYFSPAVYRIPQGYVLVDSHVDSGPAAGDYDVYTQVIRRSSVVGSDGSREEWRFYVDPGTKLLHRKEFRRFGRGGAKSRLYRTDIYEYPDKAAFDQHVEDVVAAN